MVLRRWLTSTGSPNACVVPLSLQGSSPITPRPVFGLVRDGEVGVDKKGNRQNFAFFRSMEKMAWDGAKWGQEGFFPAIPDLADIFGDLDLDFENFHFSLTAGTA